MSTPQNKTHPRLNYWGARSPSALGLVLTAHTLVLAALWLRPSPPEPVTPPKPLTVSLIEPEPENRPEPPKPRPQPRPIVQKTPPPVLAAKPTPAPAPVLETPKPTPVPVPQVLPPPEPPRPQVIAEPAPPAPPPPPSPPRPADYLQNPKPPYPALSRRLGEEGVVRLKILVNADGSVAKLELAASSGYERLDHSAMKTVQESWKFEPARQAGKPVAGWVTVPIDFKLNRS